MTAPELEVHRFPCPECGRDIMSTDQVTWTHGPPNCRPTVDARMTERERCIRVAEQQADQLERMGRTDAAECVRTVVSRIRAMR